jgi:hypothetical protein
VTAAWRTVILAGLVLGIITSVTAAGAGVWKMIHNAGKAEGLAECKARSEAITEAVEQARQAFREDTTNAVAQIRITSRPVVERITERVRTERVYSDCVHPGGADGLRDINRAITGRDPSAGGPGAGANPGAAPGMPGAAAPP